MVKMADLLLKDILRYIVFVEPKKNLAREKAELSFLESLVKKLAKQPKKELKQKKETTIVMVTHDQRLADQTEQIIRLFDGRRVN